MKEKGFKKELLRHLGISLGVVLVFIIALILVKNGVDKRAGQARDLTQMLADRNRAAESFILLRANAPDAREYQRILENRLPREDDLINFPKDVVTLANQEGVELGFRFGGRANDIGIENVSGLTFSMTLAGAYSDAISFIKQLENHQYFIDVESVELTEKSKEPREFNGIISGTIFIQNES